MSAGTPLGSKPGSGNTPAAHGGWGDLRVAVNRVLPGSIFASTRLRLATRSRLRRRGR